MSEYAGPVPLHRTGSNACNSSYNSCTHTAYHRMYSEMRKSMCIPNPPKKINFFHTFQLSAQELTKIPFHFKGEKSHIQV